MVGYLQETFDFLEIEEMMPQQARKEYSFCFLHTKAGVWFLLKITALLILQSILTRAQLKLEEGAFSNRCMWLS